MSGTFQGFPCRCWWKALIFSISIKSNRAHSNLIMEETRNRGKDLVRTSNGFAGNEQMQNDACGDYWWIRRRNGLWLKQKRKTCSTLVSLELSKSLELCGEGSREVVHLQPLVLRSLTRKTITTTTRWCENVEVLVGHNRSAKEVATKLRHWWKHWAVTSPMVRWCGNDECWLRRKWLTESIL